MIAPPATVGRASRLDSYQLAHDVEEVNTPAARPFDMPSATALARIGSHLPAEPDAAAAFKKQDQNDLVDVEKAQGLLQEERELYDRFTLRQKHFIVAVVAFSALLSPFSSASFLPCIPQISHDLHISQAVVDYTVAIFLVAIGLAPLAWAPYATVYGRRPIYLVSLPIFVAGSLGVALSRSLGELIATRIIQGIGSSSVLSVGAGTIGDIYHPTERGKAMGLYLAGALVGPSMAPLVAGILTEYVPPVYPVGSWRSMQWLLAGMGVLATVLSVLFLPETIHVRGVDKYIEERDLRRQANGETQSSPGCGSRITGIIPWPRNFVWVWLDPLRPLRLLKYPNVLAISMMSSFVLLTTYCLIVPLTYTLGPRFGITNSAVLGTLFIAQGAGNMIGSRIAGHVSDRTVRVWMDKRGGVRIPEDRLRGTLISGGIIVPGSLLACGFTMQYWTSAGGLALSLLFLAISGIGLMGVLAISNTYLVDVMQKRSAEAIAVNNCLRYLFAAGASAVVLPLIKAIGVAAANGIAAVISLLGFVLILATIKWGEAWRARVDNREAERSERDVKESLEKGRVEASRRTSMTLGRE